MNKIKCIVLLVMFMLTSTISASSASSDKEKIDVDPFGSYTGRGINPDEIPVQDADDL